MRATSRLRSRTTRDARPSSSGGLLSIAALLGLLGPLLVLGCTPDEATTTTVATTTEAEALVGLRYPLDSLDEILTAALSGATVSLDTMESADGGGSVRVAAADPVTVALVETGDLDIEDATLIYRAKLRADGLEGRAYLEMWCSFRELGEYFSRGLDQPVEGTTDWVSAQTPFFLEAGQNPDNVKLNLVIEGTGTVWVDQLELTGVAAE